MNSQPQKRFLPLQFLSIDVPTRKENSCTIQSLSHKKMGIQLKYDSYVVPAVRARELEQSALIVASSQELTAAQNTEVR